MAKVSPTVDENTRLDDQRGLEEKTNELINRVQTDQADMQDWLAKKLEWYERRFSRVDRSHMATSPWVGASTMWLPVSDLYIGRTTPFYMQALFGTGRVARMKPVNEAGLDNVRSADLLMENILRGGGVNSMPDLEMQCMAAIDSMCTHGLGLLKTYYSYRTRASTETIRRDDMPGILSRLIIIPNLTDQQRREQQARFPDINPPEFEVVFGTMDVNPINKAKFSELAPQIERQVKLLYGLDMDEREDGQALKEIMDYLRSGTKEESKAITKREILEDTPRILNVPLQDLIVPVGAQLDLSRVDRVTQRMWFTPQDLMAMKNDEMWVKSSIETALDNGNRMSRFTTDDELTFEMADRASDFGALGEDELIEIWQTWHYEGIADKNMPELVCTVYEPNSAAVMRKMPFAPDHGQIPVTALPFEITDTLYRSPRGIPEILDDVEIHIGAWHRWLENNMQISTATSLAVSRGSLENPNDIEAFPGMILPVENASTDVAPIPWPQVDVPIERLQQFYLQWPERLIGGLDTENLQASSQERRTATEVGFIAQNRDRLLGQRGMIFLKAFRKPLREVWQLWKQFGPREAFAHVAGTEPQRVTQHMTRGRFDIEPVAANGQHDPAARQQLAAMKLQTAMQVQPLVANDPRGALDITAAFLEWLEAIDPMAMPRLWKEHDQQTQQAMQEQGQAQAQRLQELADLAEQARVNSPMTDADVERLLAEVRSDRGLFPHGTNQEVIQAAAAAFKQAMDNQAKSNE